MMAESLQLRAGGLRASVGVKTMAAEGLHLRILAGVKAMAAEGSPSRVFPIDLNFFSFDKFLSWFLSALS